MIALDLIGIGTGNPDHLTQQAVTVLNAADLVLIPRKGPNKADLADLRALICDRFLTNPATRRAAFDMPVRDTANPSYRAGVDDWHDAVARAWSAAILSGLPQGGRVALLVWGDPALYDSSLRIAGRLGAGRMAVATRVIPGLTALQVLAAAHGIPLNSVGAPFLVTTGRRLRDQGWPAGTDTLVVMLDGDCAFRWLAPLDIRIWWGAYLGMTNQMLDAGPLAEAGPRIIAARADARRAHGWIMDTYILRRDADGAADAPDITDRVTHPQAGRPSAASGADAPAAHTRTGARP